MFSIMLIEIEFFGLRFDREVHVKVVTLIMKGKLQEKGYGGAIKGCAGGLGRG